MKDFNTPVFSENGVAHSVHSGQPLEWLIIIWADFRKIQEFLSFFISLKC